MSTSITLLLELKVKTRHKKIEICIIIRKASVPLTSHASIVLSRCSLLATKYFLTFFLFPITLQHAHSSILFRISSSHKNKCVQCSCPLSFFCRRRHLPAYIHTRRFTRTITAASRSAPPRSSSGRLVFGVCLWDCDRGRFRPSVCRTSHQRDRVVS